MTDEATSGRGSPIIFDGWRSISISLYMALVGYSVMVSLPVLSTAAVDMLGFTEEQVGRVWGQDLLGLSIGAVIAALLVARVNRRMLVLAGIVLCIGANALCMFLVEYEQMMFLRVGAGIGSGIFTAVSVASLGATTKPVRAFNMLLLGFSFSAAAELHILPQFSMNGIFLFFISRLRYVPCSCTGCRQAPQRRRTGGTGKGRISYGKLACTPISADHLPCGSVLYVH